MKGDNHRFLPEFTARRCFKVLVLFIHSLRAVLKPPYEDRFFLVA